MDRWQDGREVRSHVTTNTGTLTVTAVPPPEHATVHYSPLVMLSCDERWLSFTARLTADEARKLAGILIDLAGEAEGR